MHMHSVAGCVVVLGLLIVFEEDMMDTCTWHVDLVRAELHLCLGGYIQGCASCPGTSGCCNASPCFFPAFLPSATLLFPSGSVQSMQVSVHISLLCM